MSRNLKELHQQGGYTREISPQATPVSKEIQPQMNRIDADKDEKESDPDISAGQNGSGLSNHPLHLRSSCSSVVGLLPSVGTLIASGTTLQDLLGSDGSKRGDAEIAEDFAENCVSTLMAQRYHLVDG